MSNDYKISVTKIPEAILQVIEYKLKNRLDRYKYNVF